MTTYGEELLHEMESLGDFSLTVRAELEQSTFTLDQLLALEPGELLSLARPTGENIDVYAEEVLIGWGEVLLVDGTLTVRIASLRDTRQPDRLEDGPDEKQPAGTHAGRAHDG